MQAFRARLPFLCVAAASCWLECHIFDFAVFATASLRECRIFDFAVFAAASLRDCEEAIMEALMATTPFAVPLAVLPATEPFRTAAP